MRFDELDTRMRVYETLNDRITPPDTWMIARLDGRGFTKLAEVLGLDRPFDVRFQSIKNDVCFSLLKESGFDCLYIYHQSDEISILFKKDTQTFNRKHRKFNSVLAGFTSVQFNYFASLSFSVPTTVFDCRIIELPIDKLVIDYFSWRQADASRNCLNTYVYWKLRHSGLSGSQASKKALGLSVADKHNLLFNDFGINFSNVPKWQVNGTGFWLEEAVGVGFNPITQQEVPCTRNICQTKDVEHGDEYRKWLEELLLPVHVSSLDRAV